MHQHPSAGFVYANCTQRGCWILLCYYDLHFNGKKSFYWYRCYSPHRDAKRGERVHLIGVRDAKISWKLEWNFWLKVPLDCLIKSVIIWLTFKPSSVKCKFIINRFNIFNAFGLHVRSRLACFQDPNLEIKIWRLTSLYSV